MSKFSAPSISDSAGESASLTGSQVEPNWGDVKVIIPRSWIHEDDEAEIITLQVKLPCCTKDRIRVKIWNKRQILVHAAGPFHHYKLEYEIPVGAGLLSAPTFAFQTEILTCRFKRLNPVCSVCRTSFPRRPIATKDEFARVFNLPSFEYVQPRHWVNYDGSMALFEAHLKGCKSSSQINFHIANDKVVLLASLSPQHHYYLGLRLESSAGSDWEAYFDRKMEIFTCTIPLLGHYECGKCMAKRHHNPEGTSKEKVKKAASKQMEKASSHASGTYGQETRRSPFQKPSTSERDNVNVGLDFIYVTEQNKSLVEIAPYSETRI